MSETSFDIMVIGSGPGGYVCAIRAAHFTFSPRGRGGSERSEEPGEGHASKSAQASDGCDDGLPLTRLRAWRRSAALSHKGRGEMD